MATINLGRIKPVWQGLWAASTAYVKDDIVRYDVDSYICTAAHTSSANFANDSANWDLVAQGSTIPSQSGNAGTFLTTDGTDLSWGFADYVKLASVDSTTSVSGIAFPTIFSDNPNYNSYKVIVRHLRHSELGNPKIRLYTDANTVYSAANYAYNAGGVYTGSSTAHSYVSSSGDTEWELADWSGHNSASGMMDLTFTNLTSDL